MNMNVIKRFYILKPLVMLIALILLPYSFVHARSESLIHTRTVTLGQNQFEMGEYWNQHGEYEVRVYLKKIHRYAMDSKKLIVVGRAIDVPESLIASLPEDQHLNPKIITTWFLIKPTEVLEPFQYIQTMRDPWPTVQRVIETYIPTETDWHKWVLLEKFAATVSLAASSRKTFFEELVQEQLTLYDLEIRLNHRAQTNPKDPFLDLARGFIANSWKDIQARIDKHMNQDIWVNIGADVAITLVGGKLISLGIKGAGKGAAQLAHSRLGVNLSNQLQNLRSGVTSRVSSAAQKVVGVGGRLATTSAGRYALNSLTLKQKTSLAISYLHSRSVIGRMALDSAGTLFSVAKAGVYQTRYVGMVAGIQLTAETLARPEDLFDPDPLVMVEKMSQDQDLIQNMAYMSNETFWMAGVATHFASSSLKKRLALCASVALVSSFGINMIVGGEPNPERIALDTSWESIVGNVQTQIDMRAMQYFEGLSERSVNPKLRFAGYALAIVSNQGAGYYGYAEVTHLFENRSQNAPQMAQDFADPKIVLVPLLTDESTFQQMANNTPF